MALREIIEINLDSCDGCGLCAQGCPEGALRVIEGKARMVGENLCDGLGACIGTCPRGAISIVKREAEVYDETRVIEGIAKQGAAVISAHLEHLENHGQDRYLREARAWLDSRGITVPEKKKPVYEACPGTLSRKVASKGPKLVAIPLAESRPAKPTSTLGSWPVQLHLINPRAPQFEDSDLLVAADCSAYTYGAFHADFLEGRSLAIACPKLDDGRDLYIEKLAVLLSRARSVRLLIMEVPCCSGLLRLLLEARERAERKHPIKVTVIGIQGVVLREEER